MISARRYFPAAVAFWLATAAGFAGDETKPAPKVAAKPEKSSARKAGGSAAAKTQKTGSRSTRAGKSKKAAPRGQQRPTPERYRQIEEALASRGYLLEEPTGKWNAAAVEALRNFQADHDLPPTGRLDALSLTQLGLGPQQ